MKTYNVEEAFERLKACKVTTNKESVRRWLRQGVIKGIAPSSRKEGWKISQKELDLFIQQRVPDDYTTNVVKKSNTTCVAKKEVKEQIRADMWIELVNKNIWEGYVEIKKSAIRACIEHRKYSKELEIAVWQACEENSREYRKPRVSYLLEAFRFKGKRLLLDKNFESIEEQVIFPIIEEVRQSNKK